mgnify:CR=1 FL=1
MKKMYLGDSVYAEWSNFGELVLTTENGGPPSNIIVLEQGVLETLRLFLDKAKALHTIAKER